MSSEFTKKIIRRSLIHPLFGGVKKGKHFSLPIWDEIRTIPHQIINQIIVVHIPIKVWIECGIFVQKV